MWVGWGPECTFLYNDAYIDVLGAAKHPWALGRPASEVWAEIWDVCGPLADAVFKKGEAAFVDDVRLFMRRRHFTEETFYSFSYSPIRDESGNVGGLFCPSTDATAKNLNARRLATLSELAAKALAQKTSEAACATAVETLAKNPDDVPFGLLYLIHPEARVATLSGAARLADSNLVPEIIPLEPDTPEGPWPVREAVQSGKPVLMDLDEIDLPFMGGADQRIQRAMILPLSVRGDAVAVLVAGVSPARPLDAEYRTFFTLVGGQVATAIANAQALEDERRRAEALAELDRAKTTFFSNISHELRTPLTLMLGPIEEILDKPDHSVLAENRALAQVAHRSGVRLLKLVNTLLDFSRIEAGRVHAHYVPTDLAAFTAELASVFRSAVERAGLRFVIDCPTLPEPVYVDREMWEKIVLNLLSNALKFTFEGEIRISLLPAGDFVELRVSDTGVGIPAEELPKIFERFHRVKEVRSRTHEGSGIGLALVRELASFHGGDTAVTSTEGQGTSFTVTVRTGTAHLVPERVSAQPVSPASIKGANPFVEEAMQWLPDPGASEAKSAAAPDDAPLVLLADDNTDMRDYVARLLAPAYRIQTAADGEEAFARIQEQVPDIVISDVMMPRLDGFGLLQKLRAEERTRTIPIILLSARAGEEARVDGLDSGADDYLTKPFSARELLARVRSQLDLAQLRRKASEAMRKSEARFRAFVTASSDVVYRMSANWNDMLYLSGRDFIADTEGINSNWLQKYIHPDDQPHVMKAIQSAIQNKSSFEMEHRVILKDGSLGWTLSRAIPMFDEKGEVIEWFGAATDMTERKRAEDALREKSVEAEAASRAKDDFLAALSHELRNPLTPVLMSSTELAEDPALPAEIRNQLAMIQRNVALEARLIDDLLDLTRISRGKLTLHSAPVDAHSLLRHAEEIVRADMAGRKLDLLFSLSAARPFVMGDAARLQQVFWNLLKNAVKFTPDGGRIVVRTSNPAPESLRISVEDSGHGIPSQALEKIFLPFEQGHLESQHRFGGLGLGLSISKALVDLHGGSLQAASEGLNKGATFTLELATTATPQAAVIPAPDSPPSARRGLRILLVEDHAATLEVMTRLLKRDGHQVMAAANMSDALDLATHQPCDIVISDLGLPDGSGVELMRRLRKKYACPAIALSGFGMEADFRESAEAGFCQHLVKPVSIADLRHAIRRWTSA
jgi:PAS domain S-box-containing protein